MRVGDDRGVSLMEILMVVVAVAVMAGMAMPSLLGTMERYRLRAAAWELAGDFRLARQKADQFVKIEEVCSKYGIPKKYLEQLLDRKSVV